MNPWIIVGGVAALVIGVGGLLALAFTWGARQLKEEAMTKGWLPVDE